MRITLQYEIHPSLGRLLYRQRIWKRIYSIKGVSLVSVIFLFCCGCIVMSRIPWQVGLAPDSMAWVLISFLIAVLGVAPVFYLIKFLFVFTTKYSQAIKAEKHALVTFNTVIIDEKGLLFIVGDKKHEIAWEEIKAAEHIMDTIVFSCRNKDVFYIPKSEIPINVLNFIESKAARKNALAGRAFKNPVVEKGIRYYLKLVLFGFLFVFLTGLVIMAASLLAIRLLT